MSLLRIAGTVLIFISLVFAVVATAIHYWYYLHIKTSSGATIGYLSIGLWKKCIQPLHEDYECYTWDHIKKESVNKLDIRGFHACQAVMIVGFVVNAIAVAVAVITTVKQWSAKRLCLLTAISAVCYIVTLIVFACTYQKGLYFAEKNGELHAGFGLVILATVATLVGSVLHIAAVRRATDAYQRM